MTDRRRRSYGVPVYLTAAAAFLASSTALAWQMESGQDPALGASASTAVEPATPPRRVLVRRIQRRIIITRVLPARVPQAAPAPTQPASAPSYTPSVAAAPAPAPVAAAPAPAPVAAAPAPAPAPAPVTRTS